MSQADEQTPEEMMNEGNAPGGFVIVPGVMYGVDGTRYECACTMDIDLDKLENY